MANEIKTPLEKCRERNRTLRRSLFRQQKQAAMIGNMIGCSSVDIVEHIADLKAKCEAYEPLLRDALVVIDRAKTDWHKPSDYADLCSVSVRIAEILDTQEKSDES